MKNPIAGFDSGHSSHAAFLCRLDVDSSSVRWALTNTEIKSKFYCNWCDRGECPWHRTCIRIFLYCRIGESSWRMRTQFRSKDSMKTKRIGPDGEHDPSWPVAKKERDWYTCDNSVDRDKRFNTRISFFQNKNVVDLLVKWNEASTWVEKKLDYWEKLLLRNKENVKTDFGRWAWRAFSIGWNWASPCVTLPLLAFRRCEPPANKNVNHSSPIFKETLLYVLDRQSENRQTKIGIKKAELFDKFVIRLADNPCSSLSLPGTILVTKNPNPYSRPPRIYTGSKV